MSGRKSPLLPFQFATSQALTSAGFNFSPTNIQYQDNVGIQLNVSAGLTGTFSVQVSLDYTSNDGTVNPNADWATLSTSSALTGAGTVYFDLNQLSSTWIRVVYNGAAGDSGTASGFIAAKQV